RKTNFFVELIETPTPVLQLLVLGVMYGLLYGVLALGLSLVWGVMKVVNFAHGDFVIVGAYASYWAFVLGGLNPVESLLFTLPLGLAMGAVVYLGLIRRVEQSPQLMSLLLTFGLSTLIIGSLLYIYTPTSRAVPFFLPAFESSDIVLPGNVAVAAAYALIVAAFMELFLHRTFWGKAIRAVTEDRNSALLVGVNPTKISLLSFMIGISVATSVGSMVMLLQSISPISGAQLRMLSFVIVVLGGLGSPTGALVGGILIGVIGSISSIWLNAALTPVIGFIILVLVLIVRPYGLMGSK
ncbi:MAG TPA: branched-chain amino acid ABC transporter permease, partial [Candidatus Bathyarchaeia archaeon]|nr:branched-chain amino acid ABC transporter permease [Candidatus Bathyarchaeia archaeon]